MTFPNNIAQQINCLPESPTWRYRQNCDIWEAFLSRILAPSGATDGWHCWQKKTNHNSLPLCQEIVITNWAKMVILWVNLRVLSPPSWNTVYGPTWLRNSSWCRFRPRVRNTVGPRLAHNASPCVAHGVKTGRWCMCSFLFQTSLRKESIDFCVATWILHPMSCRALSDGLRTASSW